MIIDKFSFEAEIYDYLWGSKDYSAEVKRLVEIFRGFGVRRVLDIGCGTGGHALTLGGLGYFVVGLDASFNMVRKALSRAKDRRVDIDFVVGDMRRLPFRLCVFDAVYCLGFTTHHLTGENDLSKFSGSAYSVLRHGGLFVFDARNIRRFDVNRLGSPVFDRAIKCDGIKIVPIYSMYRTDRDDVFLWRAFYIIYDGNEFEVVHRRHLMKWFYVDEVLEDVEKQGFKLVSIRNSLTDFREFNEYVDSSMLFIFEKID